MSSENTYIIFPSNGSEYLGEVLADNESEARTVWCKSSENKDTQYKPSQVRANLDMGN